LVNGLEQFLRQEDSNFNLLLSNLIERLENNVSSIVSEQA